MARKRQQLSLEVGLTEERGPFKKSSDRQESATKACEQWRLACSTHLPCIYMILNLILHVFTVRLQDTLSLMDLGPCPTLQQLDAFLNTCAVKYLQAHIRAN